MPSHTIGLFNSATADAYAWLDAICEELDWEDRHRALRGLRAALHVLRDYLSNEQNAKLSAQLPTLLRGIYFEGWHPAHTTHDRSIESYLDAIAQSDPLEKDVDPFEIARAVYAVLARHISAGEVEKIVASLPHRLRILWE
ncbi:MAG TPA: DUF2267 domain-containing protein [Candidatus Acidoferrum sp.]|jgi:uncharacterized protein (DUF2267 family)|nr:DUF2267 domain-containing protein [Candidatus Acidoferrum sp.]